MQLEEIKNLLLEKHASYIDYPFRDEVMTLKVESKLFAIVSENDNPLRVNLKCEPNDAIAYRDIYESVIPGYHMNKKHWNTIILDDTVPQDVLKDMIDQSYELVFSKLTKKEKEKVLSS